MRYAYGILRCVRVVTLVHELTCNEMNGRWHAKIGGVVEHWLGNMLADELA